MIIKISKESINQILKNKQKAIYTLNHIEPGTKVTLVAYDIASISLVRTVTCCQLVPKTFTIDNVKIYISSLE